MKMRLGSGDFAEAAPYDLAAQTSQTMCRRRSIRLSAMIRAAAILLMLSAGASIVLAGAATQPSEQPVSAADSIKVSFAQLGDPNPDIRDAAFVRLLQLKRAELPELRKVVEQTTPVLPAQEAVLRTIVSQAYLSGEPYDAEKSDGFLGVLTATAPVFADAATDRPPAGRVIIAGCVPGFAGARCLRAGDVVLGIDELKGIPLTSGEVFRGAIRQFGPGITCTFSCCETGGSAASRRSWTSGRSRSARASTTESNSSCVARRRRRTTGCTSSRRCCSALPEMMSGPARFIYRRQSSIF